MMQLLHFVFFSWVELEEKTGHGFKLDLFSLFGGKTSKIKKKECPQVDKGMFPHFDTRSFAINENKLRTGRISANQKQR